MPRTSDDEVKGRSWYLLCPFFDSGRPSKTMARPPTARMVVNMKDMFLTRALYDAVEDCNIQQLDLLLSRNNANPSIMLPEEGMAPFHLAAGHENQAFSKLAVSLFLHYGGDPNARCDGDRTVLHIAVAWNRVAVVRLLLDSTFMVSDPYLTDEDGLNVFNYAVKFGAWEPLTMLQSFADRSTNMKNPRNRVKFMMEPTYDQRDGSVEKKSQKKNKNEKSVGIEPQFAKSDTFYRSSGYFNETENEYNISVGRINKSPRESSSSSDDSFNDILNKNISIDYRRSDKNLSTHVSFDEFKSMDQSNDDCEDLENISFPSGSLYTDDEQLKIEEIELTNQENNFDQSVYNVSSVNSELMTDISGLSSFVCSDDYYTCPDTNSKLVINRKIDKKTDFQPLDKKVTGSFHELSYSIPKLSTEIKKMDISEHSPNLQEDTSSLSDISEDYDTDYVRQSLRKFGCPPGPLVPTTKQLYVRKLNRVMKDEAKVKNDDKNIKIVTSGAYSCQLTKVLIDNAFGLWRETIKSWSYLEKEIIYPQSGPSFTYLLLDPRITKNLPARAEKLKSPMKVWKTFISSIFYIGKGTKSRPSDHMMEAFNSWVGTNAKETSQKTKYILELWREDTGVVCVQAFHHLTANEAHIREATMIDAIGLDRLTNEKRGTYYDKTIRWKHSDRCKLGCHLLYRALQVFLADGERQLKPVDLT